MSTGVSSSKANESSSTTDNKQTAGDNAIQANSGGIINIETLDAGLIAETFGLSTDVVNNAMNTLRASPRPATWT
jgi:hypothetical protein